MNKREFWVIAWRNDDNEMPLAHHFATLWRAENEAKKLILKDYDEAMVCEEISNITRAVSLSRFR